MIKSIQKNKFVKIFIVILIIVLIAYYFVILKTLLQHMKLSVIIMIHLIIQTQSKSILVR